MNSYYAWDGLGNAAQTLSSGGSVTNTFSWDAYGKGVATSASSDPYSGFGGQWGYYTDHETGLTLCGARFYDSSAGRRVTRDPAGYGGGINLYAYCGNNPLSGIDPFGLSYGSIGVGVGAGVATAGVLFLSSNPVGWAIAGGMAVGFLAGTLYSHYVDNNGWGPASADGAQAGLMTYEACTLAASYPLLGPTLAARNPFAMSGGAGGGGSGGGGSNIGGGGGGDDIDLPGLMNGSGLMPTQKQVYQDNLNEYADAMRKPAGTPGAWDWNKTATDPRNPMIVDSAGNIVAGHHRFIGAGMAGVDIPDGVVKVLPGVTSRIPRPWSDVTVLPGRRP